MRLLTIRVRPLGHVPDDLGTTKGVAVPRRRLLRRVSTPPGGRPSPEIGAQLFLSARAVEWHLGRIFTKLGIGSRRELHAALASRGGAGPAGLAGGSVADGLAAVDVRRRSSARAARSSKS